MDLRKLPPSMLLTLGLACGPGKGSDETTVDACLTPATTDEPSTGPGSDTDIDTGPCLDVGPCLSEDTGETTTGTTGTGGSGDSTFGPCLSPEPPTSTGTGSGSDSGSSSDTGSGSDSGTTGAMEDEPAPSRAAALERVLERGTLPADVAARLRSRSR